jgi:hypothetical protein
LEAELLIPKLFNDAVSAEVSDQFDLAVMFCIFIRISPGAFQVSPKFVHAISWPEAGIGLLTFFRILSFKCTCHLTLLYMISNVQLYVGNSPFSEVQYYGSSAD